MSQNLYQTVTISHYNILEQRNNVKFINIISTKIPPSKIELSMARSRYLSLNWTKLHLLLWSGCVQIFCPSRLSKVT
jgi:hypothetical protein